MSGSGLPILILAVDRQGFRDPLHNASADSLRDIQRKI
jgi:hypothetical protein